MIVTIAPGQLRLNQDYLFVSLVETIQKYESLSDDALADLLTSSDEDNRRLAQAIIYWRKYGPPVV